MGKGYVAQKIAAETRRAQAPVLPTLASRRLTELRAKRQAANAPKFSTSTVLHEYRDDPVRFFRDFLRVPGEKGSEPFVAWGKQCELAEAVRDCLRVVCRSGHKIGKSKIAAAISIWFAVTRSRARVMLTAPTERQVKKALWYEIRSFWNCSPALQQLIPEPALDPSTGCVWVDGRELFGFTASNADNVSGPGGPDVLVIVDEGSGVPRAVWEALQGIRAGGGKVLALGNPTQTSGWFYDAFHERRDGWKHFQISSTDTPNYIEGRAVVPGLAGREFVAEIAGDYDEDSPIYAVRVLGNFPSAVANAVIGLGLLEEARERWDDTPDESTILTLGVDVARFGDDYSACSVRRGMRIYTPAFFEREKEIKALVNGYDSTKVAGMVLQCMRAMRAPHQRTRINIDSTGGYGGAVADVLRDLQRRKELDDFVTVCEVNVSETSSDPEKWPLVRDELWFGGRSFFRAQGSIYPKDPRCDSELVAPTYAPTASGQNKVEPKSETKKRIGRSPDRAESALLAMYDPPTGVITMKSLPTLRSRWAGSSSRGYG